VVHRESDRPSTDLEGSWVEKRARAGNEDIWFDAPYDLGVAPGDTGVCYVTDLFRTYRTLDGGKTWAQVHSARVADERWTSRGLDVTTAYGVHFDPFDPRRVLISYTDIGAFLSEDGGESWTGATEGVPDAWRNTTYWIAFDPQERGLAWGAFSGTHDLPRPKMWRRRDRATYHGGIGISRDGGRTWTPSGRGLPDTAFTHVLLDSRSPRGARTLYACAFGRGVYTSTDGGASWSACNKGLPGEQPFAWRLSQAKDGRLYLVVARRSEDGTIGGPGDGALYPSTDGAGHWTAVPLPKGSNGPAALTIDPQDDRRLYLSAWGVANPAGDTGGGVFVSADAGQTWRSVLPQSPHVYDVTADTRQPGLLYACGFDQAAWRSTDRGETWTRIRGFNFKWGHRVGLDPVDADRIWITTFGGSVWRGPAAGDPIAPEDVVR
jgi:photosystem II stability/assembly factor-like uncharacterized protein